MAMECNVEKSREELLREIDEYKFALIDLGLYLDIHTDDVRALCLRNEYSNKVKILCDKYQRMYGPLHMNFPCNKWRWVEKPFPWERGMI